MLKQKVLLKNLLNYIKSLIWSLDNRKKVLAIVIAGIVLSVALIPMGLIKSEFIPVADQSSFTINMKLTPGSTLKQTDEKVLEIEKCLQETKEVKKLFFNDWTKWGTKHR